MWDLAVSQNISTFNAGLSLMQDSAPNLCATELQVLPRAVRSDPLHNQQLFIKKLEIINPFKL